MTDLALILSADSSDLVKATKDLSALDSAAEAAASGINKFERNWSKANRSLAASGSGARFFNAREMGALNRASSDYAATFHRVGAGSQVAATGMQAAAGAANRYTTSMRGVNNVQSSVGNQFAQLNDVVVTAWGGMNPALIGMQQGMQMVQGFAGQTGPQALKTLGGAFMQLLNPVTLATVAMVAGGAALIQWGTEAFGASEDADSLEERMDGLVSVTDSFSAALRNANLPMSSLIASYGSFAEEASRLYDTIALIEEVQFNRELQTTVRALHTELDGVSMILEALDFERSLGDGMGAARGVADALAVINNEFGLSEQLARQMNASIEILGDNPGPAEAAAALESIVLIMASANTEVKGFNSNLITMAANMANAAQRLLLLQGMRKGGGTGDAPTAPRSGRGGKDREESDMDRRLERIRESFNSEYQAAIEAYNKDHEALVWHLERNRITRQEYDSLIRTMQLERFGLDYELNLVNYQRDQDALQVALDQQYISHENYYMRLRELQDNYYSNAINTPQNLWSQELSGMSSHFSQMNSLAGGGYDSLLRAQRVFAASSALINAYVAATEAMVDPTLPWYAKLAAYGAVLSAGMGAVNAIKGGGGGGGAGTANVSQSREPEVVKNVLVNVNGPDWLQDMVGSVIDEIQEQSKNGRVIVARNYS